MRAWLNKNSKSVIAVTIVIVFVIAAGAFFSSRPQPPLVSVPAYFYDLGTNQLFTAQATLPPIDAPSGFKDKAGNPGGVVANVFACSDCADPKDRFIGFLETYTLNGRQIMLSGDSNDSPIVTKNNMAAAGEVRKLADPKTPIKWVDDKDNAYEDLVNGVFAKCKDARPIRCKPPA